MLKQLISNIDLNLSFQASSEEYTSDRKFYNDKILNFSSNNVINPIIDSEIYEYTPENSSSVNLNLFFLHYVLDNEFELLKDYLGINFENQYNKTKIEFGLINNDNQPIQSSFNNVFENRQPNGLREPDILSEQNLTEIQKLTNRPYYVRDVVGESTLKKPLNSGIPIFYNSYVIPFWASKEKWFNDKFLFSDKSYFYNSFLLLEFFDSTDALTQRRVFSIPILINEKNNKKEFNSTSNLEYYSTLFNLFNGGDGFSLFFLNNFNLNDLYARYSFWDALNGRLINLIPSSNLDKRKKWLQNSDLFQQNSRYVRYNLNYSTKKYKIFEYDYSTSSFDKERYSFDLYELFFDDYYSGVVVENENIVNTITNLNQSVNPFYFDIKNINGTFYAGSGLSGVRPRLSDLSGDFLRTYLNITYDFLVVYDNYNTVPQGNIFGELNSSDINIPIINKNLSAYKISIKEFSCQNIDNKKWLIKNISLENITVAIDDKTFGSGYYNEIQTPWNSSNSGFLSECLISLKNASSRYEIGYNAKKFTTKVAKFYMGNPFVFRELLLSIERERYNRDKSRDIRAVPVFLDKCFSELGVSYFTGHSRTSNYDDYAYDQLRGISNVANSEIYNYIEILTEKFSNAKVNNPNIFNSIVDASLSFLDGYMNATNDEFSICRNVVDKMLQVLSPMEDSELLDDYIMFLTNKNINTVDKNRIEQDINLNYISFNLDRDINSLGYELRDYLLNLSCYFEGNKFLNTNDTSQFKLDLIIGNKLYFAFLNASEIKINGNIKITVSDENSNIKNIFIPINNSIKPIETQQPTSNNPLPQFGNSATAPRLLRPETQNQTTNNIIVNNFDNRGNINTINNNEA